MLLRQVDRKIGLTQAAAKVFCDACDPSRIGHQLRALITQRVFAQCQGREVLNDLPRLRHGLAMPVDALEALAFLHTPASQSEIFKILSVARA